MQISFQHKLTILIYDVVVSTPNEVTFAIPTFHVCAPNKSFCLYSSFFIQTGS
jgi:hypothetical protein